jgi:hypothetical protein
MIQFLHNLASSRRRSQILAIFQNQNIGHRSGTPCKKQDFDSLRAVTSHLLQIVCASLNTMLSILYTPNQKGQTWLMSCERFNKRKHRRSIEIIEQAQ